MSGATSIWIPQGTESLCSYLAILRGTVPVCGLTQALLHCCTLYNPPHPLKFSEWQSCDDRGWNLNMTSNFDCFGALAVWTGAQTWLHVWAWRMGSDAALYSLGAISPEMAWPSSFLELSKIQKKQCPTLTVFQPLSPWLCPPDCAEPSSYEQNQSIKTHHWILSDVKRLMDTVHKQVKALKP